MVRVGIERNHVNTLSYQVADRKNRSIPGKKSQIRRFAKHIANSELDDAIRLLPGEQAQTRPS
jgi:hypothetical protein